MPIYEYRCEACHHRFEAFLAARNEQPSCPKCSSTALQRLMSTFASSSLSGYRSVQPSTSVTSPDSTAKGGCGGGCACH